MNKYNVGMKWNKKYRRWFWMNIGTAMKHLGIKQNNVVMCEK